MASRTNNSVNLKVRVTNVEIFHTPGKPSDSLSAKVSLILSSGYVRFKAAMKIVVKNANVMGEVVNLSSAKVVSIGADLFYKETITEWSKSTEAIIRVKKDALMVDVVSLEVGEDDLQLTVLKQVETRLLSGYFTVKDTTTFNKTPADQTNTIEGIQLDV